MFLKGTRHTPREHSNQKKSLPPLRRYRTIRLACAEAERTSLSLHDELPASHSEKGDFKRNKENRHVQPCLDLLAKCPEVGRYGHNDCLPSACPTLHGVCSRRRIDSVK